jgi:hypothetical protein
MGETVFCWLLDTDDKEAPLAGESARVSKQIAVIQVRGLSYGNSARPG